MIVLPKFTRKLDVRKNTFFGNNKRIMGQKKKVGIRWKEPTSILTHT